MELKDFISNTLTQIVEGVVASQDRFHELGGVINPHGFQHVSENIPHGEVKSIKGSVYMLCDVQFEVSLTSDNSTNSSSGIAVLFGAFSLGGKTADDNRQASLNRIKFNIPILLPNHKP